MSSTEPVETAKKSRLRFSWTFVIALAALVIAIDWNRIACHYLSNHNREIIIDKDIDELWELLKDDEELKEYRDLCKKYYNVQRLGSMPHGNYKEFAILQKTKKNFSVLKRSCFRTLWIDLYDQQEPYLYWYLMVTMNENTDDIIGIEFGKQDKADQRYEVKDMYFKIK